MLHVGVCEMHVLFETSKLFKFTFKFCSPIQFLFFNRLAAAAEPVTDTADGTDLLPDGAVPDVAANQYDCFPKPTSGPTIGADGWPECVQI